MGPGRSAAQFDHRLLPARHPYVFLGGPAGVFETQIRLAAEAGVDLVSFPVDLPWPKPGEKPRWSTADAQCQAVLDANPKALLLPRIGMDAPAWWLQAHPDDVMVWDMPGKHPSRAIVASPDYLHDAAERLAALIAHVEEKFGPHVAGYHPCGQNTGEWFYQDTWDLPLNGYAKGDLAPGRPGSEAAMRAMLLCRRPGTIRRRRSPRPPCLCRPPAARLQPAYSAIRLRNGRSSISRSFSRRRWPTACAGWRMPRAATHGRKLVVFFYGYLFEFGPVRNGPATSGHYALRRVLNSPDIDVLCSPISYIDRGLGQSAPAMTAAESVALAGKMWLYEDDTSTYLSTGEPPGSRDRVHSIEETNSQLLRNTSQCALRNFGTWWMDLGASGWFNDRRMWAEMKRLAALDDRLLAAPRPFRPEVAAVIDEASMIRVAAGGQVVAIPGVFGARIPLGRMGTPYGQYLLDDVVTGHLQAKMYVFLTAWLLSPHERERLLAATHGSMRVWCYAPGYFEEHRTSLDAMRELTGFRIKKLVRTNAWAQPTAAGKKLGLHEGWGIARPIEPLLAAADATAEETLATYPDGSAAVALRNTTDGLSLFVGPPGLTAELLRLAARKAGVHLFTQTDCNVYANGPYLVLHAARSGAIEIDTGRSDPVRDLFTGQVSAHGPKATLRLDKGETRVLLIEASGPANK